MKQAAICRLLNRLSVVGMLTFFALLAGCAENTTGPAPSDGNPPGTNATIVISDPVPASEADSVRANVQKNSRDTIVITIDQAIATALSQAGGGELLGVNLNYDDDELNYECIVRQGGRVYVVRIDPQSGSVEKKDTVSNQYYTTVIVIRNVPVKVKEAKEKAKKFTEGDVVECNLENVDDRPTYIVVILTRENRYVTVYVDAETGKERKLKDDGKCDKEDDDDDDKHKNKRGRGHYRHGKGHGYGHHYHCHCKCEDDDDGNGGGDTTKVPAGVISQDSAKVIVRGMMDSAKVIETKIKVLNDSTAFYEIKLERDSNKYEVSLNAFTGALVSIKQTAGDFTNAEFTPTMQGSDTLVKLSVARTAAIAQLAGTVQSWKLENDTTEGKWVYTFEIKATATGETKQVLVDAKTGTFIRIK